MKRILLFFIIGINVYAFSGNIGVIGQIKQEPYEESKSTELLPFIILNTKYLSLEGVNIKAHYKLYDSEISLSFEPGLDQTLLNKGDLSGKILTDRKAPEVLNLGFSKTMYGNLSYQINIRRDFESKGNTFEVGAAYQFYLSLGSRYYAVVPKVSIFCGDSNYADYYYNFTKEESDNLGIDYTSLSYTRKIKLGLTTNMVLSQSFNLRLMIKSEIINKNVITNKENEIKSSIGLGLVYRF